MRLMIAAGVAILAATACTGPTGMAGSAKRLCADSGVQVGTQDFKECWQTAEIVGRQYELRGRFAMLGTPPRTPSSTISPSSPRQVLRGSVAKGLAAYNAGDYETAYMRWLPLAQRGDAAAQNNMGLLFERGLSSATPKSDETAAEWFLLAAQQGLTIAMHNLAGVQTRLGHVEAAASWRAMAAATEQQQLAVQQQQSQAAAALGYALGCALGGGCAAANAPVYRQPTAPAQNVGNVRSSRPKPPECRLSTWQKDINGNPKVECR